MSTDSSHSAPLPQPVAAATVLVVDDEPLIRWSVRARLEEDGLNVLEAADGKAALLAMAESPDCILLDMRLPDCLGLDLLETARRELPDTPVLMMTVERAVELAVEAMRRGAAHYLSKPLNLDELAIQVARNLQSVRLQREVAQFRRSASAPYDFAQILGRSQAMEQVRRLLERIASTPSGTVLITGESGTGKDLSAKAIHYHSARAGRPFMNITCSAIQDTLLESELFGHERGAFTDAKRARRGLFEEAAGGTVFLDEIGETSANFQAKLLRFLEDKTFKRVGGSVDVKVDVRIIAATNRDLEAEVRAGRFREDLYYRLRVLPIELPPLRARGDDVALLATAYVRRFAEELRRPLPQIEPEALLALCSYPWPGNIRELRNVVERAVLLGGPSVLRRSDFLVPDVRPTEQAAATHDALRLGVPQTTLAFAPPSTLLAPVPPPASVPQAAIAARSTPTATAGDDGSPPDAVGITYRLPAGGVRLENVERDLVRQAMTRTAGNQSAAARLLGLSRDQLRYRLDKFDLHRVGQP